MSEEAVLEELSELLKDCGGIRLTAGRIPLSKLSPLDRSEVKMLNEKGYIIIKADRFKVTKKYLDWKNPPLNLEELKDTKDWKPIDDPKTLQCLDREIGDRPDGT